MQKYKETEKIIIDKENISLLEEDIIIRRGIERYMYVRQFVYGKVLDIACGVGYGTYLMSKNPDIDSVTGADKNEKAIEIANKNFKTDYTRFLLASPEEIEEKYNVLVSLETIEHLINPSVLQDMADRCEINEIIISFPRKKTTHYNPYHMWDFRKEDIKQIFEEFECYREYDIHDSSIMNFIRIKRNVKPKKRYLNKF